MDISKQFEIKNSNLISACVSVAIFSLSLFIYGERYSARADEFKACYLKLKELYECSLAVPQKMRRYAEILHHYENQSDSDYDEMVFDAYLRGQNLRSADGPVSITWTVFCKVFVGRLARKLAVGVLFGGPVVVGLLWIRPNGSG